ncbi:hypothetical protein TM51_13000 [Thermobifida fusca TM51]|uniref:Uncharacterized protein n=1 Tax=Thermobifida fusca TM51 TaxID=1169414 RepID=A0A9P2WP47_THEFU|nr:hypothetical protein [Thermobifida fusca]EOR70382.1 hypothetical protein TM51_13000 [Thermobifida fusca TM51]
MRAQRDEPRVRFYGRAGYGGEHPSDDDPLVFERWLPGKQPGFLAFGLIGTDRFGGPYALFRRAAR